MINKSTSKAIIPESPLLILPTLAIKIGLNEAVILQQMHFYMLMSKHLYDNKKWIYNTYSEWQKQFPFWSIDTVRRTITSLEKQELIISGNFNKFKMDKTKWYTINYDNIPDIEIENSEDSEEEKKQDAINNNANCHDPDDSKLPSCIPKSSQKSTSKIKKEAPEPKHTGTDCSSLDTVDHSVSQNNKLINKDNKESQTLIIEMFYKDYEKLYGEKLELTPKEIGCIKNLLKKNKDSFKKKYDLLLRECKKEKNTFFKLTPSILLYSWNQLVEIKKETWEERMERIKKGDLHYE